MEWKELPYFSSFSLDPIQVTNQAVRDGVSIPLVATQLRRWALGRQEVEKIVIGHNSQEYTIAVQIQEYDEELVEAIRQEAYESSQGLSRVNRAVFVLSRKHSDASMFQRHGSYLVYNGRN